jgi:hypothetical protein
MKKIGNNKEIMRNNESGKKSDGQLHHTDFAETIAYYVSKESDKN